MPVTDTVARTGLPRLMALAVAGVLLAACGGAPALSHAQYQQKLDSMGTKFSGTLSSVFNSKELQSPNSLKQAADKIREGANVIRQAARELRDVTPPADAKDANHELVKGLNDFADELDQFADDAEAGNLAKVKEFDRQATNSSLPAEKEIEAAIKKLDAAGYNTKGG